LFDFCGIAITSRRNYAKTLPSDRRAEECGLLECQQGDLMLKGAAIFLLVGIVAALLGFTTIAGASFVIAKVLAGIFLFMFLMLLVLALFATRTA
jgi:uncharacterized membrane protein YtjA (UPF0391 family)